MSVPLSARAVARPTTWRSMPIRSAVDQRTSPMPVAATIVPSVRRITFEDSSPGPSVSTSRTTSVRSRTWSAMASISATVAPAGRRLQMPRRTSRRSNDDACVVSPAALIRSSSRASTSESTAARGTRSRASTRVPGSQPISAALVSHTSRIDPSSRVAFFAFRVASVASWAARAVRNPTSSRCSSITSVTQADTGVLPAAFLMRAATSEGTLIVIRLIVITSA